MREAGDRLREAPRVAHHLLTTPLGDPLMRSRNLPLPTPSPGGTRLDRGPEFVRVLLCALDGGLVDTRPVIVTSSPLGRTTPFLAQLGVPFAMVRTPNRIEQGEPAPHPVLLALIGLSADLADVLYVGDMTVGQEAARRAGVSYVHTSWGYGAPSPPAPFVAESPKHLAGFLEAGPLPAGSPV
ncbi:HAD family hydrolase [Streptomyces sp. NPDC057877]|uniref:HAD family hydrolase n=1 Tax=Streptomyces sp. NPDC057877 TaxID=3346269 RepID=UPI0036A182CE